MEPGEGPHVNGWPLYRPWSLLMFSRALVAVIATAFIPFLGILLPITLNMMMLPLCSGPSPMAFCEWLDPFGDNFYRYSRIFFFGFATTLALLLWRRVIRKLQKVPKGVVVVAGFLLGAGIFIAVTPSWWGR